jgi:mycothiol synthase
VRDFVPGRDAVVAEYAGGLTGYAAVFDVGALVFVHPDREGEGIGRALLDWTEMRGQGQDAFRQRVGAGNQRAQMLLESAGYQHARSVYTMAVDAPEAPEPRPPPEGVTFAQIDLERDLHDLHEADKRGFQDNADYHEESFAEFHDEHLANPDVHPLSSLIARRGEATVGFVLCRRFNGTGYIDLLVVDPTARRQGLGAALLLTAIGRMREHGAREIRLDVASDNPNALRLYRGVGMTVAQEVVVMEKLTPTRSSPGASR